MNRDRDASVNFDAGVIGRTAGEIAGDPTLSNARKIELLTAFKEHHAAPQHEKIRQDADVELEKLLKLGSGFHNG